MRPACNFSARFTFEEKVENRGGISLDVAFETAEKVFEGLFLVLVGEAVKARCTALPATKPR